MQMLDGRIQCTDLDEPLTALEIYSNVHDEPLLHPQALSMSHQSPSIWLKFLLNWDDLIPKVHSGFFQHHQDPIYTFSTNLPCSPASLNLLKSLKDHLFEYSRAQCDEDDH